MTPFITLLLLLLGCAAVSTNALGKSIVITVDNWELSGQTLFSGYFDGHEYSMPVEKEGLTLAYYTNAHCRPGRIDTPEQLEFVKNLMKEKAPAGKTPFWLGAFWERDESATTFTWIFTNDLVGDFLGARGLPKPSGIYNPRNGLALVYDKSTNSFTAQGIPISSPEKYNWLCVTPKSPPPTTTTTTTTMATTTISTPATTTTTTGAPTQCTAECPATAFEEFTQVADNKNVYTIVRQPKLSWTDASAVCASQCGTLAIPENMDDIDFITNLATYPVNAFRDSENVWMGGDSGTGLFYRAEEILVMRAQEPNQTPSPFICQVAKKVEKPAGDPFTFFSGTSFTGGLYKVAEGWARNVCNNVPEYFKNRAASLDTKGQCVEICSATSCDGTCVQVVGGTPASRDLKRIGMGSKLVSFRSC